MFYYLYEIFADYHISGSNLFRYITFRSAMAAVTALAISLFVGPYIIAKLKTMQIGEEIRTDGPQSHLSKAGTPTMGGLIILASVLIPTLLWADLSNTYILLIMAATLWMGVVGFIDDYLKAVKKIKKGLIARYKTIGQIALGLLIGSVLYFSPEFDAFDTITTIPFVKDLNLDFGYLYIPFVIFVITAMSNAVNLTDGLDGLAIGVVSIAVAAFALMCYVTGNVNYSDYLNILYIPQSSELTIFCTAMLGAGLGFLWYNAYPAQVFMGDTGALAMGASLGTLAILIKKELLLPIVGGVFVAENLSVILQVMYFKYSKKKYGEGRRIFLMAPVHHHYELKGWHETKVVTRFWIMAILCALLTLTTFKVR
ncbi:phospho-N-acetylmuramoyl-pentapeptide-transferase [bacterium]|nr:phospho-N-acetylmuramoyl-pentapeptide-transferase [bacterium]